MAKRQKLSLKDKTTDPAGKGAIISSKGRCGEKTKKESLKNKAAE